MATMETHKKGIHHITALSGDAQRNADFYVKDLGMRLVKKSVNQDDPGTYHLFYGNAYGSPGSGITFFPWPQAQLGRSGVGEAVSVAFAAPSGSMDYWIDRLESKGIKVSKPYSRFDHQAIGFSDPDEIKLELVFDDKVDQLPGWEKSTVPAEHGVRGFHGTTLRLKEREATAEVLEELFEFRETARDGNSWLYTTDAPIGSSVIIEVADSGLPSSGRGTIHHVAFRVADDDELESLRERVSQMGLNPTPYIDRHWFHSVYFRSPGGVLFEIATDGPGYNVDEDRDKLGEKLILPPWLEPKREMIENRLPEVRV